MLLATMSAEPATINLAVVPSRNRSLSSNAPTDSPLYPRLVSHFWQNMNPTPVNPTLQV